MGFDFIQIHGTIPADCQSDGGLALWQAVNIAESTAENADELFVQSSNIRGYVVDGAEYGSGKTFGWEAEEQVFIFPQQLRMQNCQFVLAGGLNIENVQTESGCCIRMWWMSAVAWNETELKMQI